MDFELNEEQRFLAESVERFLNERYDFEARRAIVNADTDSSASEAVWSQLAEMGVLTIPVSEAAGGFGGGAVDLMATMQAAGAALLVEPLLANLVAARLVDRLGSQAQREALLPGVMDGSSRIALAHTEDEARFELANVQTQARPDAEGFDLSGVKRMVAGAPSARQLVVSARTPAGTSLFIVPADAQGVAMSAYQCFDDSRAADVRLSAVRVGADALLGAEGAAQAAIDEAHDFAIALLCAEAVGAIDYAVSTTLEYLKTRKQFGVTIGSFQALQHRMVEMFIELEQARSMSLLACAAVDAPASAAERARIVCAAKIKVADACRLVSQEAVQMHGGIGMTDELKVSHTFRRLTVIAQQFGDADHHLERYAALQA